MEKLQKKSAKKLCKRYLIAFKCFFLNSQLVKFNIFVIYYKKIIWMYWIQNSAAFYAEEISARLPLSETGSTNYQSYTALIYNSA